MQRQRNNRPVPKSPAQKLAKNISSVTFVMCLILIAVIFVFSRQKSNETAEDAAGENSTEVDRLASKDLETAYPETPVEVMKLYGRINQCMYNTEMEEEEFDELLSQLRKLYSAELLEQNEEKTHSEKLKTEISDFKESKKKIVNYSVGSSSSVKYETIKDQDCAYIEISFFISENGTYSKSFQDYILVKEDNDWKILGFKQNHNQQKENS